MVCNPRPESELTLGQSTPALRAITTDSNIDKLSERKPTTAIKPRFECTCGQTYSNKVWL